MIGFIKIEEVILPSAVGIGFTSKVQKGFEVF